MKTIYATACLISTGFAVYSFNAGAYIAGSVWILLACINLHSAVVFNNK